MCCKNHVLIIFVTVSSFWVQVSTSGEDQVCRQCTIYHSKPRLPWQKLVVLDFKIIQKSNSLLKSVVGSSWSGPCRACWCKGDRWHCSTWDIINRRDCSDWKRHCATGDISNIVPVPAFPTGHTFVFEKGVGPWEMLLVVGENVHTNVNPYPALVMVPARGTNVGDGSTGEKALLLKWGAKLPKVLVSWMRVVLGVLHVISWG